MKLKNEYDETCKFVVWGHNDRIVAFWAGNLAKGKDTVIDPPHDKQWDIQVIPADCKEVWSYDVAHDIESTAWPNFKHDTGSSVYNAVT